MSTDVRTRFSTMVLDRLVAFDVFGKGRTDKQPLELRLTVRLCVARNLLAECRNRTLQGGEREGRRAGRRSTANACKRYAW